MPNKKKLQIKERKFKEFLKNNGREHAKKDFFELLKRAATTIKTNN